MAELKSQDIARSDTLVNTPETAASGLASTAASSKPPSGLGDAGRGLAANLIHRYGKLGRQADGDALLAEVRKLMPGIRDPRDLTPANPGAADDSENCTRQVLHGEIDQALASWRRDRAARPAPSSARSYDLRLDLTSATIGW